MCHMSCVTCCVYLTLRLLTPPLCTMQNLFNATPPLGKTHQISKVAITFESIMKFE